MYNLPADKHQLLLQGLQEYNSDTFDDWRDLLEEQERRMRDDLDASKVLPNSSFHAAVSSTGTTVDLSRLYLPPGMQGSADDQPVYVLHIVCQVLR